MSGSILLYDIQSPINIGMILRVAEIYRRRVLVVDAHRVFARAEARRTISDFATGALERNPPRFLAQEEVLADSWPIDGRAIATTSVEGAWDAWTFGWNRDDCLMLGNEYDGLPEPVERRAAASVRIPMPDGFYPKPRSHMPIDATREQSVANDGRPSLNVATAGAILCCLAYCALYRPGTEI
jgi:tRNA G18 (ribose-2'-O)-methylase SpoU